MYVRINKNFFEKNKAQANKDAIAEDPNEPESKNQYLWAELPDENNEITEIDETDGITLMMENKLGSFCVSFKPDLDDLARLMEILAKKVNKIKAILEAAK